MSNAGHDLGDDPVADAAASWVLRCDRGLSPKEQDDFMEWLAADPRHGAALARFRRHWTRLDALAEWRPRHGAQPNPDLLMPRPRRRLRLVSLAPALLAAAGVAVALWLIQPADRAIESAPPVAAVTDRSLEDGSVVRLNRGAAMEVQYTAAERRIRLVQGEAHFTVTKDSVRPFIVTANGVDVRAVGTAFNVRSDSTAVEVLVTEGRVQIQMEPRTSSSTPVSADLPALEARQRAVVVPGKPASPMQIDTLTAGEIERVLSWQHRFMEFTAAPLSEIAAEFNRRNSTQLIVIDPELARTRITATFRTDNVDGFVRLLESGFSVRSKPRGQNEVLLYKSR
jgi:transmembrane sensor